ncbi:hypothetical protein AJ80_09749 [Polytolypa hystricis UAMH7299]|uniref:Rhodopsin domain-containing protein n=1 Tax=Polytolypa hystricis (strain UAMH7299) TaxID=1447883 RepID=A0A2B7WKL3_POLH7|nr:hypothetical protein AJ80_09749 [Polytolypa hystricis UAMH7299]
MNGGEDGYVYEGQQQVYLGFVVGCTVVSGIVVVLRLWSRKISSYGFGWDDYVMMVAYFLMLCQTIVTYQYIKLTFVGIHIWDVPKNVDQTAGYVWGYANQFLYNTTLAITKASALLFLWRLDRHSRLVMHMIAGVFYLNLICVLIVLIVLTFQCNPIRAAFDGAILPEDKKCIHQGAFLLAQLSWRWLRIYWCSRYQRRLRIG